MAKSNISPSANNSFTHIEAKNSYADSVSTGFKHKYAAPAQPMSDMEDFQQKTMI